MAKSASVSRRSIVQKAVIGPAVLATAAFAGKARADGAVDLQLVLAVDASGSVNQVRFELQKQGYVAAFRNERVVKAIQSGAAGAIAVTMVQWTGPWLQALAVPWSLVKDRASADAFAAVVEASPRRLFGGGTSISGAIDHGATLFASCPFTGGRKVIDVSGDGANNRGRPSSDARDQAVADGITINGLPILEIEPFLDQHYRSEVIGGVNAFLVVAATFAEFADAILKKLITEIAGELPGPERRV